MMEKTYGVPARDGIAMWVADMDFRPPACVQAAVEKMAAHGVYGYFGDDGPYLDAIRWWMRTRHGWEVEPGAIFTAHGLVNGTGTLPCDAASPQPGDAVMLMTPVYHAFARVIKAAGRDGAGMPAGLAATGGTARLDFDAWESRLTGREKHADPLFAPQSRRPGLDGGAELRATARFLPSSTIMILVSDEIHHDLVYPRPEAYPRCRWPRPT
jgi:cysteine-S-conjugate beta-lyase